MMLSRLSYVFALLCLLAACQPDHAAQDDSAHPPQQISGSAVTSFAHQKRASHKVISRGSGDPDIMSRLSDQLERDVIVGGDGEDTVVLSNGASRILDGKNLYGVDRIDTTNHQPDEFTILFSVIEHTDKGVLSIDGDDGIDQVTLDPALEWICTPVPKRVETMHHDDKTGTWYHPVDVRFQQGLIWISSHIRIAGKNAACR